MQNTSATEQKVAALLANMTLAEKIGQLILTYPSGDGIEALKQKIAAGLVGAVLNEENPERVAELQQTAVSESRHGIPLLIGRDVIHGFKTIFPIPLGQAATWNPEVVRTGARIAALEASSAGVNWTFAPMMDIARDPRWGRVAESLGEDPCLSSVLGAAMVEGFQGTDLSKPGNIAACLKHFAGYGASESGRDYNTTNIPEPELRNTYLPPFLAALEAGAASVMTSFSDLNGIPATANQFLLRQILRDEWDFDGFVVSDWDSVRQLSTHGLTACDEDAAYEAAYAGVDMEMAGDAFERHLEALVHKGAISEARINEMAGNVLRVKLRLGLFEQWNKSTQPEHCIGSTAYLAAARDAATESIVLLKNENGLLPLRRESLKSIAVIGPLADDAYEQLGTWIFDGDPALSSTPLRALMDTAADNLQVRYCRGTETTRSNTDGYFAEAVDCAKHADAAILFLGEESILSGEAHCRADIGLPGNQTELLRAICATGTPVILVLMAGRPLAIEREAAMANAVLFAFHPGTMAGPAITDILFGVQAPSGRLPVTFPRVTGQVPIYYNQKRTGKPATPETFTYISEIPARSPQISVGNTSFHLDVHYTPLFPFGFGLSYTTFTYTALRLSHNEMALNGSIDVCFTLANTGNRAAKETVQLYIQDIAASIVRPVRELKAFTKVHLQAGEVRELSFKLTAKMLGFYNRSNRFVTEPGKFLLWVASNSAAAELQAEISVTDKYLTEPVAGRDAGARASARVTV